MSNYTTGGSIDYGGAVDERLTARVNLQSFGGGDEADEGDEAGGKYVPPKLASISYEAERDKAAKVLLYPMRRS